MKNLSISILAAAISGCSSWPDHGHGGDAQVDTSHDYYIDQVDMHMGHVHESKGDLETQWSLHSLKLDSLVLRGAQECLPARVREVSMMARRSRRELDGYLLEDARNSIIIYQRELDELERRLIYIKRHTECGHSVQLAQTQSTNHSASLNKQQVASNRKLFLLNLLNDDYSFDVDSDALTRHYREKLVIAGHYLAKDTSIRLTISGHTDSDGDFRYNQALSLKRARQVQQVLVEAGVDEERLVLQSFGEQLPIESNQDALGKMLNRRVSVAFIESSKFYIPGEEGDLFDSQMDMFGFKSEQPTVNRVKYLKYWNKQDRKPEQTRSYNRGVIHTHVVDESDEEWQDDF